MAHRSCAVSRLFQSALSPALSLCQLRLFFVLLLCISIISTALSTARLLNASLLSQQPFLYFSALFTCIVGLIQCRSNHLGKELCQTHTTKRLRQATLFASIAITLFTLATLPTPTSANAVGPDITRIDMWLLLALTLCVQICIPSGRARHLVCGVIALAHSIMVIVTRFTSERISSTSSDCLLCWNSIEVRFWREIASNLVAFTISSLIGWNLSCQNDLERWRCFCVALHASVRQSTLQSTQKKLSRISKSIVPPALIADLEYDFSSPPCVWSSPLVIYLRNVSFLSAELVGFYTSNWISGNTGGGSMSPMISNVGIQELERYPQPSSLHVVTFTNHLIGRIKALCENHGCYAVHVRPGEILCIAGYPEVRVDHANSCVQLALAVYRLLRSISNATHVQLEARMAIHTGEAFAAVLGQSMLTFDLLGADVLHLRRHLRPSAKPGRVLVSRATFDQLPEGYEGELGPTVVDPSTNRHVTQCETLYVQPRKSADTSMSSNECTETRWPTLGESISTGGLAQAFARLANHAITESGESSVTSTHSSALLSVLRKIREKDVWIGRTGEGLRNKDRGLDEATLCLKGLCEHWTVPTPFCLDISNSKISALEGRLLPNPSSSLLASLCHNLSSLPSSVSSLQACPPSSSHLETLNTSPQCKIGSCEDIHSMQPPLTTSPVKCETCPKDFGLPDVGTLCPLAEAVLWNRLFLRRGQLNCLRNALAWMLLLLLLLGVAGGLLITKVSYALIVYPCAVTWCLILLSVLSIRRLDRSSCFPVKVRQACLVFTIFLLLASLLFILTFVHFEVQQNMESVYAPWLPITQLGTTAELACLSLLLLLTLTPSVSPTPVNSAIVAAIFSSLHISLAITRFMHIPPVSAANSTMSFWLTIVPDAVAAHVVFILLICSLPWQTAKLHLWTEQWVKFILDEKVELTRKRFALEHLLENRIPRAYMQREPNNALSESTTDSLNLIDFLPPKENLATAVIAITIHGIGKGDDMLQRQRSPIRTAGLSQSITTTATTASSSNSVSLSHRSREATVIADAVRRLNRRICLIDLLACVGVNGEDQELVDSSIEKVIDSISKPSLPLIKVNSVDNCVAYALMETETKDALSKLGAFAMFLIRLFEELKSSCLQKSGEEQGNTDETFFSCLQIGLHVGATVSGVVDGPQFLLLHETLDFALRLATSSPLSPVDRSVILASSDFISQGGGEHLIGLQAIGINGSSGDNDVFLWCSDAQHIPRLSSTMRPVLSAVIQPPVVRNRTKKILTSPKFPQQRSPTSVINPNATSPPPPPPPHPQHKRNYAIGEARYQNHNSPLIANRNRKLSSPSLPPRHGSPPSKWTKKTVSLDVPEDNVDRACFAMGDVEIVNGYAQPTTRLLGNDARTSPYCVTKDTIGYSNHSNRQSAFEMHKEGLVPIDASINSAMSSENDFLAVEVACERIAQSDGVTSVSSVSPSNTTHHHSNPLYTDNEYYDEEDLSVDGMDEMDGIKHPEGMSDGGLDAGLEWLRRAPVVGDFTVSVTSNGSNYPNYRRPSPPTSNPRRTLYDPPLAIGVSLLDNGIHENQRRLSIKPGENASVSIDMLSTCAAPSVGCEYEFEAFTTDFSVNENDNDDVDDFDDGDNDQDLEVEVSEANNEESLLPESGNIPRLMYTSWMTSTEGVGHGDDSSHGGGGGVSNEGQKMSDSMLVETGGPLEDDFSEFSSSAAVAAIVSGVNDDVSSSVNNLVTYTSDENLDEEFSDSAFLPTYFPLPENSSNQRGRRLPDVAPVSLPNFGGAETGLPPINQFRKPASPPLLMDLTCVPPLANSDTSDLAEYDNLENAYSSPLPQTAVQASINNNLLPRNVAQRSGGWRPRDARNHRKGGGGPQSRGKIDQQVRISTHIVDEARRIYQRLHAMGWESALSLQTHSSESIPADPSYRNHHNDDFSGKKSILLLAPPPQLSSRIPKRVGGDYVNSQSLLRRLQGFESATVTTVTSQTDDDQLTDDGTFDSEFLEEEGVGFVNNGEEHCERVENGKNRSMLVISDLWFNLGHPRSLSNDCLPLHASEFGYERDGDEDNYQNERLNDGVLNRDVILRRAANVKKFLPPELHPFVMPGCFSSVSATTTYATRSKAAVLSLNKNGRSRKFNGHRRYQKRRHVLVAMRGRGMKRSSSEPLLPNSSGMNLDVSLI